MDRETNCGIWRIYVRKYLREVGRRDNKREIYGGSRGKGYITCVTHDLAQGATLPGHGEIVLKIEVYRVEIDEIVLIIEFYHPGPGGNVLIVEVYNAGIGEIVLIIQFYDGNTGAINPEVRAIASVHGAKDKNIGVIVLIMGTNVSGTGVIVLIMGTNVSGTGVIVLIMGTNNSGTGVILLIIRFFNSKPRVFRFKRKVFRIFLPPEPFLTCPHTNFSFPSLFLLFCFFLRALRVLRGKSFNLFSHCFQKKAHSY